MCPPNISTTIDEINIHHKITFPGPYRKGCCQQSILSFGKLFRQSYYFSKPESDGLTDAFFYSHAKLFIFITQGPIQAPTWNCHSTAKRRTSFLNKRSSASASLSVIKNPIKLLHLSIFLTHSHSTLVVFPLPLCGALVLTGDSSGTLSDICISNKSCGLQ